MRACASTRRTVPHSHGRHHRRRLCRRRLCRCRLCCRVPPRPDSRLPFSRTPPFQHAGGSGRLLCRSAAAAAAAATATAAASLCSLPALRCALLPTPPRARCGRAHLSFQHPPLAPRPPLVPQRRIPLFRGTSSPLAAFAPYFSTSFIFSRRRAVAASCAPSACRIHPRVSVTHEPEPHTALSCRTPALYFCR